MQRFGTDSFQAAQGPLNLFGIHFSQKGEAQIPLSFFEPMKKLTDTPRFLFGQTPRADGLKEGSRLGGKDILPPRKPEH